MSKVYMNKDFLIKLKLINNDIKDFKDKSLTTDLFDNFVELYKKVYSDLFINNSKEYKDKLKFIKSLNPYIFITQVTSAFNVSIVKHVQTKQTNNLAEYSIFKNYLHKNILANKFSGFTTIGMNELIYKNKLMDFNKDKLRVCCLTNYAYPDDIEGTEFYNKNNKCGYEIENDIIVFKKYNGASRPNQNINKNHFKNINVSKINDYINLNFINSFDKKYDFISSYLRCYFYELAKKMNDEFIGYADLQINFFVLLFALKSLNKNGNLILYFGNIICKPVADLILIGKNYFNETILDYTKITVNAKYTGAYVVFKGFKGLPKTDFNTLCKIGAKLLKNDSTSCLNFTITDKKLIKNIHWKRKTSKKKDNW